MTKKHYILAYFASLFTFLIMDAVWLGVLAKGFYHEQLGHLMLDELRLDIAVFFYVFYIVGVVIFAVKPAIAEKSWWKAPVLGGLFGLLAYGAYDLTNMATLKDWPFLMSYVDMAWGTFVTASSACVGYFITHRVCK